MKVGAKVSKNEVMTDLSIDELANEDIYFKNYKKKDDTGEIPITRSEKEFQDKLNHQKYD